MRLICKNGKNITEHHVAVLMRVNMRRKQHVRQRESTWLKLAAEIRLPNLAAGTTGNQLPGGKKNRPLASVRDDTPVMDDLRSGKSTKPTQTRMGLGHGHHFQRARHMFTIQRGRSQIATQVDVDDGLIDRIPTKPKSSRIDNNQFPSTPPFHVPVSIDHTSTSRTSIPFHSRIGYGLRIYPDHHRSQRSSIWHNQLHQIAHQPGHRQHPVEITRQPQAMASYSQDLLGEPSVSRPTQNIPVRCMPQACRARPRKEYPRPYPACGASWRRDANCSAPTAHTPGRHRRARATAGQPAGAMDRVSLWNQAAHQAKQNMFAGTPHCWRTSRPACGSGVKR